MTTTAQEKFRRTAKRRLLDLDLTITDLAKSLGLHRNSVSRAINQSLLPTVQVRIADALKIQGV